MNLVIDIGNTAVKAGVFKGDKHIHTYHLKTPAATEIQKILKRYPAISQSIVSSVAKHDNKLLTLLASKTKLLHFSHATPLPFINLYKTPSTLGLDRIGAVAGAMKRLPRKNVLVIDAGTCIKYDFINQQSEYIGGSISPGLNMRFEALHNFTERLPLIPLDSVYKSFGFSKKKNPTGLIKPEHVKMITGNSTKNSILTGVISGITNEINGFIDLYRKNHREVKVILTGGDAAFLGKQLKNVIFAAPHLILEGLNEILSYNIRDIE